MQARSEYRIIAVLVRLGKAIKSKSYVQASSEYRTLAVVDIAEFVWLGKPITRASQRRVQHACCPRHR